MDEELDLIVMTDDEGNEQTMEVLDYFHYEGQEYAILVEYDENKEQCECECDEDHCDCCGEEQQEAFIMRVNPVGDDQEEFLPVEEDLLEKLVDFVQNDLYADDDEYEFEDEDDEEEDEEDGDSDEE